MDEVARLFSLRPHYHPSADETSHRLTLVGTADSVDSSSMLPGTSADQLQALVGTVLADRYELVRLLGHGGMGAVYEGVHRMTERRVAVKVMLGPATLDADSVARFLREARAAGRVHHPNIVDVHDMGRDEKTGTLFIAQEFLSGVDLRRHLQLHGRLPLRDALEVIVPVAAGLLAAHAAGVIHRDIKPENIFLADTTTGRVPKLIDFGISKMTDDRSLGLTRTGVMVGTPNYMPPEQARGEKTLSAQADIWALGAVLFEVLTGRCPFVAENYNALMVAILTEQIPPISELAPGVPLEIARVVEKALERDCARRYATADDLISALVEWLQLDAEPWRARLIEVSRQGRPSVLDASTNASESTSRVVSDHEVGLAQTVQQSSDRDGRAATPVAWSGDSRALQSSASIVTPRRRRRAAIALIVAPIIAAIVALTAVRAFRHEAPQARAAASSPVRAPSVAATSTPLTQLAIDRPAQQVTPIVDAAIAPSAPVSPAASGGLSGISSSRAPSSTAPRRSAHGAQAHGAANIVPGATPPAASVPARGQPMWNFEGGQ